MHFVGNCHECEANAISMAGREGQCQAKVLNQITGTGGFCNIVMNRSRRSNFEAESDLRPCTLIWFRWSRSAVGRIDAPRFLRKRGAGESRWPPMQHRRVKRYRTGIQLTPQVIRDIALARRAIHDIVLDRLWLQRLQQSRPTQQIGDFDFAAECEGIACI